MGLQKFCPQQLGFKDKNWFLQHNAGFGVKTTWQCYVINMLQRWDLQDSSLVSDFLFWLCLCRSRQNILTSNYLGHVIYNPVRADGRHLFGNWFSFPAALVQRQQVNCFFVNGPWPPLDLGQGGVQSPKSFPERRKDLATPPPLDSFHRFLLRGVSWQFDISLYFEFHYFFPLLRIFYLRQHGNDTYWWSFVVHFFLTQFLIRTKLLQCISSAAL